MSLGLLQGGRQLVLAQGLTQQYGRKKTSTGPRALGLVEISATGKARIIPIAIMLDGKFFDAGSFKATPVPMALDFGVVYEGFRTGISQGLFTITQPGQLNKNWIAEGTWLPEGAKPKETSKKYAAPVIDQDKSDDRPVLHRRASGSSDSDKSEKSDKKDDKTASPATSSSAPPANQTPGSQTPPAKEDKPATQASAKSAPADEPINDPNRPVLRRGKPEPNSHREPFVTFDAALDASTTSSKSGKDASEVPRPAVVLPAISDAAGPDPRPYVYDLKPAEEAMYRKKMLDLAATQLQPKATTAAASAAGKKGVAKRAGTTTKSAALQLDDVKLRIFDLSNSNEPILVLSAKTPVPSAKPGESAAEPQEITLIARTNLEGEVQKLFFSKTDSQHLDVSPRMELIDAVDADGDGRGELLFRETSDAGSFYGIYRVTPDRLWTLYEGTP